MNHQPDCICDQYLLAQMQSTNPTTRQCGWDAWYRRDAPILQRFIERHCQDLHCLEFSEDLLQDCFLTGFRNISNGHYREQGRSLCAYLHGIAKNLLREVVRLQRKVPTVCLQEDMPAEEPITLDDQLYLEQILQLVQEAHYRQSILHRQVVHGLYAEEKSSQEVAGELCTTAGNARAIAHRAVNEMRAYLEQHYHLNLPSSAIRACLPML
jgi:RNA polymerase sigma factor (sigma-70 family)